MKAEYQYDKLNQLIRENNLWEKKTICYNYDAGGNITEKEEYLFSWGSLGEVQKHVVYTYRSDGWRDQLVAYDGETITYDGMGNPLKYRGMELTWDHGRELKQVVKDGHKISYTYDSEGIRTSKNVDGQETRYYLNGDKIVTMKTGKDVIHFVYDADGNLFSMNLNGENYYYLHNAQNDVIGLLDSHGVQVVSYKYDSWGNSLEITDSSAGGVGSKNPFRYREYYWDEEIEIYYINTRYFDADSRRFISADGSETVEVELGSFYCKNNYSYCDNNPIVRSDNGGDLWDTVFDVISVVESATNVIANPRNASSWVSLGADVVCALVPGLTGGGKILRAVTKSSDVIGGAKKVRNASKKMKKVTGTYHIAFEKGKHYVGKGPFPRAIKSAKYRSSSKKLAVKSIKWKAAKNEKEALIREYIWMCAYGGPQNSYKKTVLLNRIWSPGRNLYKAKKGKYLSIERRLK